MPKSLFFVSVYKKVVQFLITIISRYGRFSFSADRDWFSTHLLRKWCLNQISLFFRVKIMFSGTTQHTFTSTNNFSSSFIEFTVSDGVTIEWVRRIAAPYVCTFSRESTPHHRSRTFSSGLKTPNFDCVISVIFLRDVISIDIFRSRPILHQSVWNFLLWCTSGNINAFYLQIEVSEAERSKCKQKSADLLTPVSTF